MNHSLNNYRSSKEFSRKYVDPEQMKSIKKYLDPPTGQYWKQSVHPQINNKFDDLLRNNHFHQVDHLSNSAAQFKQTVQSLTRQNQSLKQENKFLRNTLLELFDKKVPQ